MIVVVDSNVHLRLAEPGHFQHSLARNAVAASRQRLDELIIFPQMLHESWVVMTRPLANNGLGFTVTQAAAERRKIKGLFRLIHDTPDVLDEWEHLTELHTVLGKPAHDARIVAAMKVHSVTHLLTFNTADFARYPGIVALDPVAVAAGQTP